MNTFPYTMNDRANNIHAAGPSRIPYSAHWSLKDNNSLSVLFVCFKLFRQLQLITPDLLYRRLFVDGGI